MILSRLLPLCFGAVLFATAFADDISDPIEKYRQFAMTHDGEASRGERLFANDERVGCSKCHSIDGKGTKAGPDLFSAGDQFSRRELINAVLQPSLTIAVGYGLTVIETKDGEIRDGVLKDATDNYIELAQAAGTRIRVPKTEISSQHGSAISMMPEGLQSGLTLDEFADLTDYLVSLKEPAHSMANREGMPNEIIELEPPAELRPMLQSALKFPREKSRGRQPGLVWMAEVPGSPGVFLATDQAGIVWRIHNGAEGADVSVFADFSDEVFSARGPNGLLCLVFHPHFAENHKYFTWQQVFENEEIASLLVERIASANCAGDSGAPARRVLKIPARAEHHNGGCMQFGPDGCLYIGMGDSAPNHDPQGYAQNMELLNAKMLRIDVDHRNGSLGYRVPKDNPHVGDSNARPEIWATGLREPWRFSFDSVTGDLWVGDLGQERGDEIDIVRRGENFGWNVYEGFELFAAAQRKESARYVAPVFSTRRKFGTAIVGGFVYRGDPASSFVGVYIFGDYNSKRIWGMTQQNRTLKTVRQIAICPQSITAFTADSKGNLYVIGYEGMIYQLDLSHTNFAETPTEIGGKVFPFTK